MAATIIPGNQAAKPYYTGVAVLAGIDSRSKIYIEDGDVVNLDLFKNIVNPYPHLRVHVHQKTYDTTSGALNGELCVGVYEIDDVDLTILFGKVTKSVVKTYHQVYSSTSGLEDNYDYDPEEKTGSHKDVIYYCTDTGKVYLNGIPFGGSDGKVKDVQVNSTSVLDETTGVANLEIPVGRYSTTVSDPEKTSIVIEKTTHHCGDYPDIKVYYDGDLVMPDINIQSGKVTISWKTLPLSESNSLVIKLYE